MRRCFLLCIFFTSCSTHFKPQLGDLFFQDLDNSNLCHAIESVTPGYKNAKLSHIGIAVLNNGEVSILEAIPPKVQLTSIEKFLKRSSDKDGNPKVFVGRLKSKHKRSIIEKAVNFCMNKLDYPYDDNFCIDNEKYYCSELIYEAYSKNKIFKLAPMNFIDSTNSNIYKIWENYFDSLKIDVPQNNLGINPGLMSTSKELDIVYHYGIVDGLN